MFACAVHIVRLYAVRELIYRGANSKSSSSGGNRMWMLIERKMRQRIEAMTLCVHVNFVNGTARVGEFVVQHFLVGNFVCATKQFCTSFRVGRSPCIYTVYVIKCEWQKLNIYKSLNDKRIYKHFCGQFSTRHRNFCLRWNCENAMNQSTIFM